MPSKKTSKEVKKSEEALPSDAPDYGVHYEDQQSISIRDFLYHDTRRVGSFLAQFEAYGVLQQVKAIESTAQTNVRKVGLSGGIKVPLVAQGNIGRDETNIDEERDTAEQVFDPLWQNARRFLNYLESHKMINYEIAEARIRQFVLVSGHLIIIDAPMLKNAWDKGAVKNSILRSVKPSKPSDRIEGSPETESVDQEEVQLIIDLLSILPHSTQAQIIGKSPTNRTFRAWCTLSADALVGMSTDLVLKHGSYIEGEWKMLGVLDGLPDYGHDPEMPGKLTDAEEAIKGLAGTAIGKLLAHLSPLTRNLLGRPRGTFGLTPLLIYRNVSP